MIQNNTLTVLPWYKNIEEQNHRRPYAYGEAYKLVVPGSKVPSFQLNIDTESGQGIWAPGFKYSPYNTINNAKLDRDNGQVQPGMTSDWNVFVYKTQVLPNNLFGMYIQNIPVDLAEFYATVSVFDEEGTLLDLHKLDFITYTGNAGILRIPTNAATIMVQSGPSSSPVVVSGVEAFKAFEVYDISGTKLKDLPEVLAQTNIYYRENLLTLAYNSDVTLLNGLDGFMYFKATMAGGDVYYSEVFCSMNRACALRIRWWDDEDLISDAGSIVYRLHDGNQLNYYKNELYVDTLIGKPDYQFEEEGEKRDGYFFAEKQVSEKVYRFSFPAPEFVCDALRIARMSDHIEIIDQNGKVYDCTAFETDVDWLDQGDLAGIDVEFRTNTVIKKIGRAYPVKVPPVSDLYASDSQLRELNGNPLRVPNF